MKRLDSRYIIYDKCFTLTGIGSLAPGYYIITVLKETVVRWQVSTTTCNIIFTLARHCDSWSQDIQQNKRIPPIHFRWLTLLGMSHIMWQEISIIIITFLWWFHNWLSRLLTRIYRKESLITRWRRGRVACQTVQRWYDTGGPDKYDDNNVWYDLVPDLVAMPLHY